VVSIPFISNPIYAWLCTFSQSLWHIVNKLWRTILASKKIKKGWSDKSQEVWLEWVYNIFKHIREISNFLRKKGEGVGMYQIWIELVAVFFSVERHQVSPDTHCNYFTNIVQHVYQRFALLAGQLGNGGAARQWWGNLVMVGS